MDIVDGALLASTPSQSSSTKRRLELSEEEKNEILLERRISCTNQRPRISDETLEAMTNSIA